jgi:hypothetical protein
MYLGVREEHVVRDPRSGRVRRATARVDAPTAEFDEAEHLTPHELIGDRRTSASRPACRQTSGDGSEPRESCAWCIDL